MCFQPSVALAGPALTASPHSAAAAIAAALRRLSVGTCMLSVPSRGENTAREGYLAQSVAANTWMLPGGIERG
ncbi:hypothetical protein GCM10009839_53600 [Catenulispora yoronensis]|uniref:Uncharacterized protein n=1 Tax=Catenulispora yoronensis TaxID=450799 RepID=A0ABN2UUW8_9ACTN